MSCGLQRTGLQGASACRAQRAFVRQPACWPAHTHHLPPAMGPRSFELLARLCPNATGADIRFICTEAGMFAIRARRHCVTEDDFLRAVNKARVAAQTTGRSGPADACIHSSAVCQALPARVPFAPSHTPPAPQTTTLMRRWSRSTSSSAPRPSTWHTDERRGLDQAAASGGAARPQRRRTAVQHSSVHYPFHCLPTPPALP